MTGDDFMGQESGWLVSLEVKHSKISYTNVSQKDKGY